MSRRAESVPNMDHSIPHMENDSPSENRSWLGRQVSRFGQWAKDHPYIAFAIVVTISLVVFGVLLGLALAGGGLPFIIAAGAGAGGFFLFGNGSILIARLWQRCFHDSSPINVNDLCDSEEEEIPSDWTLESFEGEDAKQLSPAQVSAILRRGPHWHGAAKEVYELNPHIVLIKAKACQQGKLIQEIERAQQIHDAVVRNVGEEEPIFLATHYIPIEGHQGLYLARRCLGDLDALLKGELEIPEGLGIDEDQLTEKKGKRYFNPNFLDFPLALNLLEDILKGFEQLHAAGYTHGDIKPENILVYFDIIKERLVAIVNDFGETRLDTEGAAVLHGDWRYSSPEQRAHQPSDVYGVGLLALRLLEQGLKIGANDARSIERCFPVQNRGPYAFTKTGIARLGGVFGRIVFHPERRIHRHINGDFSNNLPVQEGQTEGLFVPLLEMLRNMTRDLPSTPNHGGEERRCTIEAAAGQYREFKQAYDASVVV